MDSPQHGSSSLASPHALIIGAGIAGCALALFLKRAGIRATIFEAYSQAQVEGGIGGGLQMAPNGMHVLHCLGLADKLKADGVVSRAFAFDNQYGELLTLVALDPKGEFGQPAVNMTRAALHLALIAEIRKEGIPIEFDKRLVRLCGYKDSADGEGHHDSDTCDGEGVVRAVFKDRSVARGDFVVGADGAHSRTRALILGEDDTGADFLGLMSTYGFVHTDALAHLPEDEQGTVHFMMGPGGRMFGYCRASGEDPHLVMWWRNMQVGGDEPRAPTKDELRAIDTEELKQRILDVPGGWSPLARQLVTDTEEIQRGTIHTVGPLPRWFEGRAVLIGDAAHAVSPHSGQGASLALEDAMYLAKLLRSAVSDCDQGPFLSQAALESTFRAFRNGRRERADGVVAEGKKRGEKRSTNVSGEEEKPPVAIKRWFTELMLTAIFKWLVPLSFKSLYGYHRVGRLE